MRADGAKRTASGRGGRRWTGWAAVVAAAGLLVPGLASAHSGFQSSTPAAGSTTAKPVGTVTLVFGAPVNPAGLGFEARTPDGAVVKPSSTRAASDGSRWALRFTPPLAGGRIAVRWRVKAQDAHPIGGAFTFTSTAPAAGASSPPGAASGGGTTLDEFVSQGSGSAAGGDALAFIGRLLVTFGILLGIGGVVFGAFVLRGARSDIRFVMRWVRRGALAAVLGSVVRLVAALAREAGSWGGAFTFGTLGEVVTSSLGASIMLGLAGGLLLAHGARGRTRPPRRGPDVLMRIAAWDFLTRHFKELNAADPDAPPLTYPDDRAWDARRAAPVPLGLGVGALLVAPLFAGHTVNQGNRFVTSLLDLVHVLAASIWVGGLIVLTAVLVRRHRRRAAERALQLVLRFSVVAGLAVVAVTLTGVAQALVILDTPGELVSTTWGRVLIIKTGFAVVAGWIGAYNHRILLPALAGGDPAAEAQIRTSVRREATFAAVAAVAAAVLVGASA